MPINNKKKRKIKNFHGELEENETRVVRDTYITANGLLTVIFFQFNSLEFVRDFSKLMIRNHVSTYKTNRCLYKSNNLVRWRNYKIGCWTFRKFLFIDFNVVTFFLF